MKKILFVFSILMMSFLISCDLSQDDVLSNPAFLEILSNAGIQSEADIKAVIDGFNKDIPQVDIDSQQRLSAKTAKKMIRLYHAYTMYLKLTANLGRYYDLTYISYKFDNKALKKINNFYQQIKKDTNTTYARFYPALVHDENYKNLKMTFVFVMEDKDGKFISEKYPNFDYNEDSKQIQIFDGVCPTTPNCPKPPGGIKIKTNWSEKLINEDSIQHIKDKIKLK